MYVCIGEAEARESTVVYEISSNQMSCVYVCMYCFESVYVGVVVWVREEEKKPQNQTDNNTHTYSYTLSEQLLDRLPKEVTLIDELASFH